MCLWNADMGAELQLLEVRKFNVLLTVHRDVLCKLGNVRNIRLA